jgi:hypothetical protein
MVLGKTVSLLINLALTLCLLSIGGAVAAGRNMSRWMGVFLILIGLSVLASSISQFTSTN